jgi:hypothetical protein
MKKTICMIALCVLAGSSAWAQVKHRLAFRENGKFKIAQFTDIHWVHGEPTCAWTTETIKAALAAEKPDVAILTGDMAFRVTNREPWTDIPEIFEDTGTPYAVTFGNHDSETATKEEIMDILSRSPWFIGEKGPEDIHGVGNCVLPVYGSKDNLPAALLYCFDSNEYTNDPGYGVYAPIYFDQIEWYRRQSDTYAAGNSGKPLPVLAFFHIPLPEYHNVIARKNFFGNNEETPLPPDYNTGLFGSFIDKQDMMGVFVGHNHANDLSASNTPLRLPIAASPAGRLTAGQNAARASSNSPKMSLCSILGYALRKALN